MLRSLKQRDHTPEWMDDLELSGTDLEGALKGIERVNRILGGHRVVASGLYDTVQQLTRKLDRPIRIVDLGCGGGDTLRYLAIRFKKASLDVELVGLDANPNVIEFAQKVSANYSNIHFHCCTLLEEPLQIEGDIFVCSLFLHHFSDKEIVALLEKLRTEMSPSLVLINDLHRHSLAYLLFQVWGPLFGLNRMAMHDGLLSIRKAFRRQDWVNYITACAYSDFKLRWRWAFRWQLLLY